MKQWLFGVGAAVLLTSCAAGVGMQPPAIGAERVAMVTVPALARSVQAVASTWTLADVDHFDVTLEVFSEAVISIERYSLLRDFGSYGPLSPARTASVAPGGTHAFSGLTDGKLYRASVVAVGGADDATVISSPGYAAFDFQASDAPSAITATATPLFLPVAFDGTLTVTPEAPATTGGWADPVDAETIATNTADVVATSTTTF